MLKILLVGGGVLLAVAFWLYCLLDAVTTDANAYRRLPKPLWVVITLVPVLGALAWFTAGRPSTSTAQATRVRPARPTLSPDDDEAFLRQIRRRAEEQRRIAREQERRRQAEEHPNTEE